MTKKKTTKRRWSCPEGKHPGVLAPKRLRGIDLRRFCLPCSKAAGVLVERTCAANEKRAEASKAKSARKAQAKRAAARREREAAAQRQRDREVVAGIDIARELDRLWAHALRLHGPRMKRRKVPRLTVSRSEVYCGPRGASGRAYYGEHRIHLTLGRDVGRVRLCGVLAHEVAHHVAWGEDHSDRYWSCFAELVLDAYGTEPARVLPGEHFGNQRAIEDGIADGCTWVAHGGKPPRKPPAPRGTGRARVESVRADSVATDEQCSELSRLLNAALRS